MPNFLKKLTSFSLLLSLLIAALPFSAQAATLSTTRVSTTGGGTLTLAPGEVKNITITFQNTGATTWKNDGPGYISLYTYGPKYRTSSFDPGTWLSPSQVKRLIEPSVAPKATGTISFQLHAPQTEGAYKETFNLASEDTAWIPGGEFSLNITVKRASATSSTPSTPVTSSQASSTSGYMAQLVTQTANSLKVKAGKTVSFTALFKNTGSTTWNSVGLKAPDVSLASTATATFTHSTWSGSQIAQMTGQAVKPGESAIIQFFFTAPKTNGTHTAKFQLTANDISVPDAFVELPVTVTEGAPAALNSPVIHEDTSSYIEEPIIRVGILIIDEETQDESIITSYESAFDLTNTDGTLLGSYEKGEEVRVAYEGGRYVYGDDDDTSSSPLRFVPKIDHAVMTITNFDARETRSSSRASNTYRNVLEIRYNSTYDRTWVINELKMEYYLRGLAETSNISHLEFQKALLTAARTYAYYHWQRATKHKSEGYHVDAYLDQVYRGYGQEEITPRITESVEATRGRIVTYEGATAITAYFSRSNGRTRDWSDVWGGDVPWSKSVPVPCDEGETEWGHGVGMSASGALCMANEGQTYEQILKHFYTGIELDKQWQ
ncbi:MAG: NBR1-Ig-like domain-containing protein [Patescibacteria group bacterium]